jgi:hypothetical protein
MTYRPPGLEGQALRQFSAERGTGYYDSLENNAIAYNLRHMGQQNPSFPLRNFRGGPTLVGLVSLTMASLAPLAAWLLAGRGQAGASTSGRPVTPRSASTTTHVGPPGRQTG